MKTSTKLILIYSGLIVAGILSVYLSNGYLMERYKPWDGFKKNKVELSEFSVVQIQDSMECYVSVGDSCSSFQWYQPQDSIQKALNVQVRNDTLFVTATKNYAAGINLSVKQLSSVVLKNKAKATIFNVQQKELSIHLDNATCNLNETIKEKVDFLRNNLHLTVHASNHSAMQVNTLVKDLTATLDSSQLQGSGVHNSVTLTAKHGSSTIFYVGPNQLTVQKDSTSSFRTY